MSLTVGMLPQFIVTSLALLERVHEIMKLSVPSEKVKEPVSSPEEN